MFSEAVVRGTTYILLNIIPAPGRNILHGRVELPDDLIVRFWYEAVQCGVKVLSLRHVDEDCRQEVF